MQGGEVVAHWNSSSFSFHPSLILVSWKVSKRRVEFGFEAAQQWTLFPSLTIQPLHYTYMVHTRAGFNSPSVWVTRLEFVQLWTILLRNGVCNQENFKISEKNGAFNSRNIHLFLLMLSWLCIAPNPSTDTETYHANLNREYIQEANLKSTDTYTHQKIKCSVEPISKCNLSLSDLKLFICMFSKFI